MSVGLQNGAVDSAVTIAPFTDLLIQKGIGVKWLDPEDTLNVKPLLIALRKADAFVASST